MQVTPSQWHSIIMDVLDGIWQREDDEHIHVSRSLNRFAFQKPGDFPCKS